MTKWAVLVGIDHYPGLNKTDWKGCVHDVHKTSELLCDVYDFDPNHVLRLISPSQKAPESLPNFDSWPSYDNIVSSILGIQKEAGPGDIVYLHFSGCVMSVESKLALGQCTNGALDLALVPVDIVSNKRYLHDIELAVLLHDLSRKGTDVTMVVDGRFNLIEISASKLSAFTSKELDALPHDKWTERGKYTWLGSPDPELSYTLLLTRSMIDQNNEREYLNPTTEEWGGHLTSLLHETIRSDGPIIQLRTLAQRLQVKASRLAHPAHYAMGFSTKGNMSRLFLLGDRSRSHGPPIFPALMLHKANGKSIEVGAGSAHGVQAGAIFSLNSGLGSEPLLSNPGYPRAEIFQAETVRGLTSTAILLVDEGVSNTEHPLNTSDVLCSAMLRWASLTDASDRLIHGDNQRRPHERAKNEQAASILPLSPSEQADIYRHSLNIKAEDEKFSRFVRVAILGGYRHNSSTMPPDPTFGLVPPTIAGECLHLLSGDFANIYIQGTMPKQLFVYVVSFDSDFGITQIYPNGYGDVQRLIKQNWAYKHNKYTLSLVLRLAITSIRRIDLLFSQASEVLKVFVTDQPTSFTCLELPRIMDEGFLHQHPDPARTLMKSTDGTRIDSPETLFEAGTSSLQLVPHSVHGVTGYDRRKDKVSLEEPPSIEHVLKRSADFGLGGLWCCFDLSFVIHKTIETLAHV